MPVETIRSANGYRATVTATTSGLQLDYLQHRVSGVAGLPYSPETNAHGDLAFATCLSAGVQGDLARGDVILNGEVIAANRPVLDMAMSETALVWIETASGGVVMHRYDLLSGAMTSEPLGFHADRIVRDGDRFLALGVDETSGSTMLGVVGPAGALDVQDHGQAALYFLGDAGEVSIARVTGDQAGLTLYAAADRFLRADTTDFALIGNDEGRLAWHLSYRMLATASLASATGREDLQAMAVDTVMSLLASADENGNFPSSRYSLGDGQVAYSCHSGWLYHAAFAAIEWMDDGQRDALLEQAVRSFDSFESDWQSYGYRFPPGSDIWVDGVVQPWNQQATMGLLAIDLFNATGDTRYLDRVEAMWEMFVAEITVVDGSAFWHYYPRIFSDGWSEGTFDSVNLPSRPAAPETEFEDVYHILLTLPFLIRAAEVLGRPSIIDPDVLFSSVHLGGLNFAAVPGGTGGGYGYLPPWPDMEEVWPFLVRDLPSWLPRYDSGVIDWLYAASAARQNTATSRLTIETIDPVTGAVRTTRDVTGGSGIFDFVSGEGFDGDAVLPSTTAFGTDMPDVHVGTAAAETLRLMDGDDVAMLGDGNDVAMGDHGDDRLYGEAGDDALYGGFGADLLSGGAGEDLLSGQTGDDILIGGAGADRLIGGGGVDTADYSSSIDRISVNLSLGAGLGGDAHGDRLIGVENLTGTNADATDWLTGDGGGNTLRGLAGDDELRGLGGDDILEGGEGADLLDGGEGVDTADYSRSTSRIAVNLSLGTGLGGDAHGDRLTGIENLTGTNADATDWLTGDDAGNILRGLAGDDELRGLGGDDSLEGGVGADLLDGGEGVDTADYARSLSRIAVNLTTGVGLGGDAHGDRLTGIENLIGTNADATDWLTGDAGRNRLTGLAGDDVLSGMGGDDVLDGGAGNDILDGGSGADRLIGGAGDDTYHVDDAGDRVVELAAGGHDIVVSSLSRILEDHVEQMILTGGEALNGAGNAGDNRLDGNQAANTLYGLDGNDILFGHDGDDILFGGAGIDYLYGGDGDDTLHGGEAFDYLAGGAGDDVLHVNGSDNADGGAGNDLVRLDVSGRGALVTLGAGQDVLLVHASTLADTGVSYVADFVTGAGGDRLDLAELLAGPAVQGFAPGGDPFASGHVRVVQDGNDTLLQIDPDGGGNGFSTLLRLINVRAADLQADLLAASPAPAAAEPVAWTLPGATPEMWSSADHGPDRISGAPQGGPFDLHPAPDPWGYA